MKKSELPNYKLIYTDIIIKHYPEKEPGCKIILEKKELSVLDVIKLNELIFGNTDKETSIRNQKHRAYNESTIRDILNYQKNNKLNNFQLANHFKLSRNTVAKWRKDFPIDF
ncbi:helix-turn-helix domain-containing protein [Chryseobacterium panacisoli]|uniref:Helix-turn-helix domain-containing protein n=1 Tax=Chryseobacterium panacisoli TaxID=1807141 RepID=A0A5D8ZGI9_9FLAO|nr:helix-turn-helix domain-containing protein [Chryseobacterium panacisoli]TZF93770.1 helix-turn-helix domain-containing protein [Chryseobacterium panacisoli]